MTTEQRPAHSPLGASGAERWMNCPGSVALLKELKLPETDEPDFRSEGTSAHEAAYHALSKDLEGWELMGLKFGKHVIDGPISDAIDCYLNECRGLMAAHPGGQAYYEQGIDAPDFHKDFYGTLDFGYITPERVFIRDYKHGEGIWVEVEDNPQIMYYAYGLLRRHPEVPDTAIVDLGIVQPRIFSHEGPVRRWETTAGAIRAWATSTLLDAMNRTELDHDLDAGKWCRFCPAKLVCPLMWSLFGAAMTTDPKRIINLSDEALGRSYPYLAAAEYFIKAYKDETFRRLNSGIEITGTKLVYKKANRVWNEGAAEVMKNKFGKDAMSAPELRSPAEIEKLGAEAKTLVREWAFTPRSGLTVAAEDDKRPAVKVQTTDQAFPQDVIDNAVSAG